MRHKMHGAWFYLILTAGMVAASDMYAQCVAVPAVSRAGLEIVQKETAVLFGTGCAATTRAGVRQPGDASETALLGSQGYMKPPQEEMTRKWYAEDPPLEDDEYDEAPLDDDIDDLPWQDESDDGSPSGDPLPGEVLSGGHGPAE